MSDQKLLWLDCETTGLTESDIILEVYAGLADIDQPFIICKEYRAVLNYVFFPDEPAGTHPIVIEMHTKNGLWAECSKSELEAYDADEALVKIVPQGTILAGSTVHFDRMFLREEMPRMESLLHHRHLDVSSIKIAAEMLGMPKLPKGEAHRAQADVMESMAHLQQCMVWLASNAPKTLPTLTMAAR